VTAPVTPPRLLSASSSVPSHSLLPGVKQAAPGTFFAIFGAIIITFGIWKGVNIKSHESNAADTLAPIVSVSQPTDASKKLPVPVPEPASSKSQSEASRLTQFLMSPAPDLNGVITFDLIDPILEGILSGKPLTDSDRKMLELWLKRHKTNEKFWEERALQPKEPFKETRG